jgi:hypothetical protein
MNEIAHTIAAFLHAAADRLESAFDTPVAVRAHEMHFDSDAYLADIKNRVHQQYY